MPFISVSYWGVMASFSWASKIFWLVEKGEHVCENQVICEGEVEKKTLEFLAPADGILSEICIADEETFRAGDILGFVETE